MRTTGNKENEMNFTNSELLSKIMKKQMKAMESTM